MLFLRLVYKIISKRIDLFSRSLGHKCIFLIFFFFEIKGFVSHKTYLNFWVFIEDLRKFPVATKVQSSNTTDILWYYGKLLLTCRYACPKRSFRNLSIYLTYNMNQQDELFSINLLKPTGHVMHQQV